MGFARTRAWLGREPLYGGKLFPGRGGCRSAYVVVTTHSSSLVPRDTLSCSIDSWPLACSNDHPSCLSHYQSHLPKLPLRQDPGSKSGAPRAEIAYRGAGEAGRRMGGKAGRAWVPPKAQGTAEDDWTNTQQPLAGRPRCDRVRDHYTNRFLTRHPSIATTVARAVN